MRRAASPPHGPNLLVKVGRHRLDGRAPAFQIMQSLDTMSAGCAATSAGSQGSPNPPPMRLTCPEFHDPLIPVARRATIAPAA